MKKKVLLLAVLMSLVIGTSANAAAIDYDGFSKLGVSHGYIVGKYLFDSSSGFSPSLKDVMRASRSIEEGQPTTLYEVLLSKRSGAFSLEELYTGKSTSDKTEFGNYNVKYIYTCSIDKANGNYIELLD